MLRKILPILFIVSILVNSSLLLIPNKAEAAVGSFTGCVTGNLLSKMLSDLIKDGLASISKKIGSFFGSLFSSGFNVAVPVSDDGTHKKTDTLIHEEYVDQIISQCLALEIKNKLALNIVNAARTKGRDGGETWVKDWSTFQTQAQHRGENVFRAMLSTTNLCKYFSSTLKQSFGVTASQQIKLPNLDNFRTGSTTTFNSEANCTLPSNFDMTKYQQNFAANGGWEAWSRLLQPQNNLAGSLLKAASEVDKQRALAESADVNQVVANKGQVGISGNDKNKSCLIKNSAGVCIIYNKIQTPGSYIADSLAAQIQGEFAWLANEQDIAKIIAEGVSVLINRLLNLSDPNEGTYTLVGNPGTSGTGPGGDTGGDTKCSEGGDGSAWSSDQWRDYFYGQILDQTTYPTITLAALQDTEVDLEVRGAKWQNADRGDLRPRIYVTPDCTKFIDVGDFDGPWEWHPNF